MKGYRIILNKINCTLNLNNHVARFIVNNEEYEKVHSTFHIFLFENFIAILTYQTYKNSTNWQLI